MKLFFKLINHNKLMPACYTIMHGLNFISKHVDLECIHFTQMEDMEEGGERRELLVAKFLIANINNKATSMLNKSEPLEAYPESFR